MKKLIFLFAIYFISYSIYAQDSAGDTCENPIEIGPGTHLVNSINGEHYSLNCSEYDAANGNLEWYIYTPNNDYLTTISTDLEINEDLDTRVHVSKTVACSFVGCHCVQCQEEHRL